MPITRCTTKEGKSGYKWGNQGHCYSSRNDALKQMRAIKWQQSQSFLDRFNDSLQGIEFWEAVALSTPTEQEFELLLDESTEFVDADGIVVLAAKTEKKRTKKLPYKKESMKNYEW